MRWAEALFPLGGGPTYHRLPMVVLLLVALLVVAGCGGETARPAASVTPHDDVPAPPDAGMPAGHDNEPLRVRVPRSDSSAPEAVLRLADAQGVSGGGAPELVRLATPVLRPIAVGRDKQGMGRIRVSLHARIRCGDEVSPLIRYFPPPATERVRIAPGTVARTELTRRVRFALRCPDGAPRSAEGTLWADATSAWETEASSAPLRFSYTG
jgi:hypothetical protein